MRDAHAHLFLMLDSERGVVFVGIITSTNRMLSILNRSLKLCFKAPLLLYY